MTIGTSNGNGRYRLKFRTICMATAALMLSSGMAVADSQVDVGYSVAMTNLPLEAGTLAQLKTANNCMLLGEVKKYKAHSTSLVVFNGGWAVEINKISCPQRDGSSTIQRASAMAWLKDAVSAGQKLYVGNVTLH